MTAAPKWFKPGYRRVRRSGRVHRTRTGQALGPSTTDTVACWRDPSGYLVVRPQRLDGDGRVNSDDYPEPRAHNRLGISTACEQSQEERLDILTCNRA